MINSYLSSLLATLMLLMLCVYISSITAMRYRNPFNLGRIDFAIPIVFLLIINFNVWLPGQSIFIIVSVAAAGVSIILIRKIFQKNISLERIRELFFIIIFFAILIAAIYYIYSGGRYWINEGPNHDSLVYYEGLTWATKNRQFVNSTDVSTLWGLGRCGDDGSLWIGIDCSLYRGGTYTLLAWLQFFATEATGGALFGSVLLCAFILCAAIYRDSMKLRLEAHSNVFFLCIFTLAFTSTAIWGAIFNSNLATAIASSSVAVVFYTLLNENYGLKEKAILAAMWSSICLHLYGESIFYVGLIFSLYISALWISSGRILNSALFKSAAIYLGVLLFSGNVVLYIALQSFLTLKGIANGGEWAAWYLDAPLWTWFGAFLAGDLQGAIGSSSRLAFFGGCALVISFLVVFQKKSNRPALLALLITTALAICLIEIRSYKYGEHKIIQILGAAWLFVAIKSLIDLYSNKKNIKKEIINPAKFLFVFIFASCLYVNTSFLRRGTQLIEQHEYSHGISYSISEVLRKISPSQVVVINDYAWKGIEKFQKTHYLSFLINAKGARAVLPQYDMGVMRGGYYERKLSNSLIKADSPSWYVSGISDANIFPVLNSLESYQLGEFQMVRIEHARTAFAIPGSGWYECEPQHCWTWGNFTIEAFVGTSLKEPELQIELDFFYPENNSTIELTVNGSQKITVSAKARRLIVPLEKGMNKVQIVPDWKLTSPKQRQISEDARILFAAIKSVYISDNHLN